MGSNNSILMNNGRKNSSNNNYESSRLFSSTSDHFSHDSYMDNRFCSTAPTSTKSSSTTNLLNWLPKKPLLSVKQRLAKRFSADNSPPYKLKFDSSSRGDSPTAFRFRGRGEDCSASLVDMSRPVKHTSKRSRTWYREHCKIFREFLFTWTLRDLHCLVVEFEAAKALSRLKWQADAARQPAPTIVDDLLCALRDGIAADTLLELIHETEDGQETIFQYKVHRAFLTCRSFYFLQLFAHLPSISSSFLVVVVPSSDFSPETLNLYLYYLYTGIMPTDATLVATILRDRDKRTTDDILNDLKYLYRNFVCDESDSISTRKFEKSVMEPDVLLIFSNCTNVNDNFACSSDENSDPQKHSKFKCHSVILAARSPFFRSLIEKRCIDSHKSSKKSNIGPKSRSCNENAEFLNIILDEMVIPRQYAPVILHAMYTDKVDLSLVIRGCVSNTSCLTEVQAIASGKCQVSPVNEATEIYQIAKFLEFDKLVEGCEDIIISYITIETLPSIYSWSNECYGSKFVRRFCVNFLCSEFVKVANNVTLFDLEESILVEALRSDFLQASELEVLNTIVKWGEHQLVKKIEEREPNILMGTTHSISRKGVRRSDLSDVELREVLMELSPLIRTDFMLPVSHPMFLNAQQRNLITRRGSSIKQPLTRTYSAPYGHVCGCCPAVAPNIARPRLFRAYYETAGQLLEQRLTEQPEQLNALINLHPPLSSVSKCLSTSPHDRTFSSLSRMNDCCYGGRWRIDEDQNSRISVEDQDFAVSNQNVFEQIVVRVRDVWQSKDVKRALACGCAFHQQLVVEQTCLKVARERGLSDTVVVTMLKNWYLNFFDGILLTSATSHSLPFANFCENSTTTTTSREMLSAKSNPNLLKPTTSSRKPSQNDEEFLSDENNDQAPCSSKIILEKKQSNSEPHLNEAATGLPDLMTSLNLDNRSSSLRYNDQKYCDTAALQQLDSAMDLNRKNRRSSISSIGEIEKSRSSYLTEQDEIDEFDQSFLSNMVKKQEDEYS